MQSAFPIFMLPLRNLHMRTIRQLFIPLLLISLLFLSACNRKTAKSLSGDDGKIEVAIVQLNDVYEISGVDGGKAGNLARVAAFADSIRN